MDDFWSRLLPHVYLRSGSKRFMRPKPRALDEADDDAGFPLPRSYHAFAATFGLGRFLAGDRTGRVVERAITNPGFGKRPPSCSPGVLTRFVHACTGADYRAAYDRDYDDGPRAARLLLFAEDPVRPDYFGWDPEDVTDSDAREYAIYRLGHELRTVDRVAPSFVRFVLDDCCLGLLPADPPPVAPGTRPRRRPRPGEPAVAFDATMGVRYEDDAAPGIDALIRGRPRPPA